MKWGQKIVHLICDLSQGCQSKTTLSGGNWKKKSVSRFQGNFVYANIFFVIPHFPYRINISKLIKIGKCLYNSRFFHVLKVCCPS